MKFLQTGRKNRIYVATVDTQDSKKDKKKIRGVERGE